MRIFVSTAILSLSVGLAVAQTQVTVNVGSTLQEIDGFGVSQAFGRAKEFYEANAEPRQRGLDYLFNTETGAGLTIIRNRIGSTTTDSILPRSPGSPNGTPSYVWDNDDSGQIWFSQQAKRYGVTTIYADAWSAPGFMKTNGNEANGGYLCGVTGRSCSSGDWRQAFANMLVQYVKYYAAADLPVTHLGFLNEPDYVTSYSSMQSDGNQAASFIPTLYNTLRSAGITNISLTCCDAIGWPGQRTMTGQLVSAGMEQYLSVITSHAYAGDPNSPLNTRLKTWQTEACDLNSRWCATWYSNGGPCEGLTWANKIHIGIVNANLSAYIYWQGFEVNQFQASSYLVASDNRDVIPSGRLWAFAMWSRFIRPGARRVSTTGSVSGVGLGAFKNKDDSVIVVFTNTGGGAQNVRIAFSNFTPNSVLAYVTDNTRSVAQLTATLSGGAVTVSVPARAVVTVQLNKVTSSPPPLPPSETTPTAPTEQPTTSNPVTTSNPPVPTPAPTSCSVAMNYL
ncbi:hypothetical protein NLJ89_g4676 [Agrocybe chaxingu]|uniref:Uncharacterized protein n=1 Tax=Agrocybe chaxingu TaxID=84603 RepID=A0A9W8K007_9AGAR|nr:hypothetical protein NLJ89_g4676 [Agrocybe chaxingu]